MISPESIKQYEFFSGLSHYQIADLIETAHEETIEAGHFLFHEGDELKHFYLLVDGNVAITIAVPDREIEQTLLMQLTRNLVNKELTVGNVGQGEIFGWSALVPPHESTANARADTPCRVLAFDCEELSKIFQEDRYFGYLMMQKVAQVTRGRLRDRRYESLALTLA